MLILKNFRVDGLKGKNETEKYLNMVQFVCQKLGILGSERITALIICKGRNSAILGIKCYY